MHTPVIMPGDSEASDCVSTVQKIQVIKQAGSHHMCSLLSITCELQVFFPPLVLLTQQPTSLLSPQHQCSSGLHPSKRLSSPPSLACGEHSLQDTSDRNNWIRANISGTKWLQHQRTFPDTSNKAKAFKTAPWRYAVVERCQMWWEDQVFFGRPPSLSLYPAPTKAKLSRVLSTKCPSWVDRVNRWVSESSLQVISQRTHLLWVFSVYVETTQGVSCNNDVTFKKTWR